MSLAQKLLGRISLSIAVDVKGVAGDLLDEVKVHADALVQKTDNSMDDGVLAVVYPLARAELLKYADKLQVMADAQIAKVNAFLSPGSPA